MLVPKVWESYCWFQKSRNFIAGFKNPGVLMRVPKSQFQMSESFNAGPRWFQMSGSSNAGSKSPGVLMLVPKVREFLCGFQKSGSSNVGSKNPGSYNAGSKSPGSYNAGSKSPGSSNDGSKSLRVLMLVPARSFIQRMWLIPKSLSGIYVFGYCSKICLSFLVLVPKFHILLLRI